MVETAKANSRLAGVEKLVHFEIRDVSKLTHTGEYGFIVTNPPYGERLEDKETVGALYKTLGERFKTLRDWSMFVITSYEAAEKDLGLKADKNRKIYNGMLKTYYYSFMGKKPEKRK